MTNEDQDNNNGNQQTQSLLFSQCELGNNEQVAKLLAGRRSLFVKCVDSEGNSPLHKCQNVDCAALVLQHGAGDYGMLNRQNKNGETPLMAAILAENASVAEFLIDNGCDCRLPNNEFQLPLHVAAQVGCVGVLAKILLLGVCDVNQTDRLRNTALHYAAQHPDKTRAEQMVELLIKEKLLEIDARDSYGRSAFILGAQAGNIGACRLLRDSGCHLARGDDNGVTALHAAAAATDPDVIVFLVRDMQFTVDQVDSIGRSAIFYAVHHYCADNVAVLLKLGANVELADRINRTPMHVAAERGADECLRLLLATTSASTEAEDNNGQRPLHLAAAGGRYTTVKVLLQHLRRQQQQGSVSSVGAKDKEGNTALDLAEAADHKQICDLLRAVVAESNRPLSAARSSTKTANRSESKQQQQGQKSKTSIAESKKNGNSQDDDDAARAYPRPWSASDERARRREAEQRRKAQQLTKVKAKRVDEEKHLDSQQQSPRAEKEDADEPQEQSRQDKEESSNNRRDSNSSKSSSPASRKPKSFLEMELDSYADEKDDPYVSGKTTWITRDTKQEKQKEQSGNDDQQKVKKSGTESADDRSRQIRASASNRSPPKVVDNLAQLRKSQREFDRIRLLGRQEAKKRQARIRNRRTNYRPISVGEAPDNHQSVNSRGGRRQRPASCVYSEEAERLRQRLKELNSNAWTSVDNSRSNNRSLTANYSTMSHSSSARSPRSPYAWSPHRQETLTRYQPPKERSKFLEYFTNTLPQAGGRQRGQSAKSGGRGQKKTG